MSSDDSVLDGLFAYGPPLRFHRALGLAGRVDLSIRRRAVATSAVSWVPVFVLTLVGTAAAWNAGLASFASDVALHVRALFATPLLIVAESICGARLAVIAGQFLHSGLVSTDDRARFETAVASTLRLRDWWLTELTIVMLAYAAAFLLIGEPTDLPAWRQAGSGPTPFYSLAGWWEMLVSIPILLALILGWFWRIFLWARFLWLLSRMKLKLVATHPDLTAGLGFVGYSVRAFSPVAMAFGSIVAAQAADGVLNHGTSVYAFRQSVLGLIAVVLVLFCAPPFVFTNNLLECWRSGVFRYGALGAIAGREIERKWLESESAEQSFSGASDFSTTINIYAIVNKVYDMKLVPLRLKEVVVVVYATLIPCVPVVFMALPFNEIVDKLTTLLR